MIMTTKEKLELLWKYLLLAVIVFGIAQLGRSHRSKMFKHDFSKGYEHGMTWYSDDHCDDKEMTVDVQIEKLEDGDSTITVIINGEQMSLDDLEKLDENVYMKKMKGKPGKDMQIKIIKKKMITE